VTFTYDVPAGIRSAIPGDKSRISVQRAPNFAVSLAASVSDYTSQGDTLLAAILDLGQPAFGKFDRANLYTMLSRTIGEDVTRLLRLLPFEKFAGLRIDPQLDYELRRLDRVAGATLNREDART